MSHEKLNWDPDAARWAGMLYLAIAVCGAFSIGYVPMQIVVEGNPAASVENLFANIGIFKLGVLADSAVIIFELAISVLLYELFRKTGPKTAMIALVSRLGMIVVMAVILLLWIMPLALLSGPSTVADADFLPLVQFSFDAHTYGVYVWQLFFGVHLLALGSLVLRSPIVPRIFGWGLFIGAFGYLVQGLAALTFVDSAVLNIVVIGLLVIVTISEIGFGFWLLIRGGRKIPATSTILAAS